MGSPRHYTGKEREDTWCLGSQYWAKEYAKTIATQSPNNPIQPIIHYGILLDMVGGRNTVFYKEGFSMHWAPTVVDKVWSAAHRIGMNEYFVNTDGGYITDDHGPVNEIARIPCIDLIGSDRISHGFCATWHTVNDNIKNIDKNVLKAAGQTVMDVVYSEQ
jgi:hypothetical protein